MNLNTGKVINARKPTRLPVTDLVIQTVEAMAERDEIKCFELKTRKAYQFIP